MKGFTEITVKRFFTTEEGINLTPAATFVITDVDADEIARTIIAMSVRLDSLARKVPMPGIRLMTREEVAEFRRDEADEAGELIEG